MTCAHFGQDQSYTQAGRPASLSPFGQAPNPSESKLSDVHQPIISNEIQDMSALKWVSMRLASAWEESRSPIGHTTQVSRQVQLAPTCNFLGVRLARA